MKKIWVPGNPVAQGSKNRGRGGQIYEANKGLYEWRDNIKWSAIEAMGSSQPKEGDPFAVKMHFKFVRPPSHLTAKGNLRSGAPLFPPRHDVDKLVRAVLDSLTGVVYHDDKQVVLVQASKSYWVEAGVRIGWANIINIASKKPANRIVFDKEELALKIETR